MNYLYKIALSLIFLIIPVKSSDIIYLDDKLYFSKPLIENRKDFKPIEIRVINGTWKAFSEKITIKLIERGYFLEMISLNYNGLIVNLSSFTEDTVNQKKRAIIEGAEKKEKGFHYFEIDQKFKVENIDAKSIALYVDDKVSVKSVIEVLNVLSKKNIDYAFKINKTIQKDSEPQP